MNNKKVVVGMSGGVDSSVALMLLIKEGFEPVGVSLKYDVWDDSSNTLRENICCSEESFEIAKHICDKFGVKHHVVDAKKEFKKEVVDYFTSELKKKRTPNPCVICNRTLKFKELFDFANKNNAKYVATGHYADIKEADGYYGLFKGKDKNKDQTYTLSFLKSKDLGKILLPLGNYTKKETMNIAKKEGFEFYEKRKESQDFCYIGEKAMKSFLEKEIGIQPGKIKDTQGNEIGEHNGLHFYTIGQRKGLDLENGPYYVTDMDVDENILIVTKLPKAPELFKKEMELSPYNLLIPDFKDPIEVEAKVRYRQESSPAKICPPKNGKIKIEFASPQRAVTPGQFVVFYKDQQCLGAGAI